MAIKNNDAQLLEYCQYLLGTKKNITENALNYYGVENIQKELMNEAQRRDEFVKQYLTKQKGVSGKRVSVYTASVEDLEGYTGQNQYIVESKMKDVE